MKKNIILFLLSALSYSVVNAKDTAVLDSGFGNNGVVQTEAAHSAELAAVTLQPDGKIIACGSTWFSDSASNFRYSQIVRYNADGSLDTGFGQQGVVMVSYIVNNTATDIAMQDDGKILVAGATQFIQGTSPSFSIEGHGLLFRLNANGSIDSTFGINGFVNIENLLGSNEKSGVSSVTIKRSGKIMATGYVITFGTPTHLFVTRFNSDGTYDTNFGVQGSTLSLFDSEGTVPYQIVLDEDENALIAGYAGNGSLIGVPSAKIALSKYNVLGTLDTSFATEGVAITAVDTALPIVDIGTHIALQQDNKILVDGSCKGHLAMIRYLPDGTLDNTFGIGGKVSDTSLMASSGLGVLQNDKIAIVDYVVTNDESFGVNQDVDFRLSLFNADGSRDSHFGNSGNVTFDVSQKDYAHDLVIQPDQKIIIGGTTVDSSGKAMFTLLRLQMEDTTTGIGGNGHLNALDVQVYPNPTDGKLYLSYQNLSIRSLSLMDIAGRKLKAFAPDCKVLDISQIASGIYLLDVRTVEGKNQVFKILKQ